jgi:hypothetical protein
MTTTRPSSDLILHHLSSPNYYEIKLKAIREVKNQIVGSNRTNKLSYIKLRAVPAVADALAKANANYDFGSNIIVHSTTLLFMPSLTPELFHI